MEMSRTPYYRWGDNDRRVGRFIYARDRRWKPLGLALNSGGREDEYPVCTLRLSLWGHTFIAILPSIIKPWRQWVDTSKYEWSKNPAGGYWDQHPNEYSIGLSDGHLSIHYGPQTNDSSTDAHWGCFLPWTQWRHVRHSYYDPQGNHYWTEPKHVKFFEGWEERQAKTDACPSLIFYFKDYDGEDLSVRCRIEEMEWCFGEGYFKWLSLFRRRKIKRYLDLKFSGETGARKGSWKGGTIGHSVEMLPTDTPETAFRRYCIEHRMSFETPPTTSGEEGGR